MTPKLLYETRAEYKKFDQKIFRKHIYQESRNLRDSNYWLVKKKKKEKKARGKKEAKNIGSETDFYDPILDRLTKGEEVV